MKLDNGHFIKVTDSVTSLSSEQKAVLNRRGNRLFNEGFIQEAQHFRSTPFIVSRKKQTQIRTDY